VERLLIGLLTGGHILLEGVPRPRQNAGGETVAECLKISFSRIQFTPDLLPADVIGTMNLDQRSQEFYPKKGPLSPNLCSRRNQSRAGQGPVGAARGDAGKAGDDRWGDLLPRRAFLRAATQNPIEHEGTYPLRRRSSTVSASEHLQGCRSCMSGCISERRGPRPRTISRVIDSAFGPVRAITRGWLGDEIQPCPGRGGVSRPPHPGA